MDLMTLASNKKTTLTRITRPSPFNSLGDDVFSIIFSLLDDCFDLINCSLVCKTWSSVITKSKLLAAQMGLVKGLCLEEMITETHRLALQQSSRINVDQWKAHAASFYECRKNNALLLTGGRDKVMRLWSVNSHKSVYTFVREYKIHLEYGHLADFDFDESKIVGLVEKNSRRFICVWSRNVQQLRNAAASDLVVGGADGVIRVLDHNTGEVMSRIVLDTGYCALPSSTSSTTRAPVQRLRGRRLSADAVVDDDIRPPPITSLAVGMKKVITTHDTDYVRTWKFD
ncbi:hypothetical protein ACLB2K_019972 [Fragaria x ananassa]